MFKEFGVSGLAGRVKKGDEDQKIYLTFPERVKLKKLIAFFICK
jgi:hypothetical protein